MICHRHKCIFVHIPKTAGQSIEHVFLQRAGLDWESRAPLLLRPNDDPEMGPPRLAHLTMLDYSRYGYVTPDQCQQYFKFAFVRNPWARMLSFYRYLELGPAEQFREYLVERFREHAWKEQHWFVQPQSEFVCDKRGRLLVDFVGRFESLQGDFDEVCRTLGIPGSKLGHVNRWKGQPRPKGSGDGKEKGPGASCGYQQYYDQASREVVRQLYARDIELFQYEFAE